MGQTLVTTASLKKDGQKRKMRIRVSFDKKAQYDVPKNKTKKQINIYVRQIQ